MATVETTAVAERIVELREGKMVTPRARRR